MIRNNSQSNHATSDIVKIYEGQSDIAGQIVLMTKLCKTFSAQHMNGMTHFELRKMYGY